MIGWMNLVENPLSWKWYWESTAKLLSWQVVILYPIRHKTYTKTIKLYPIWCKIKTFTIFTPDRVQFIVTMEQTTLSKYVKAMRKRYNLTQVELSEKSRVGLRLVRELEQGKQTLRLDKVNQILNLFGSEVGVVPMTKSDERWNRLLYFCVA